MRLLLLLTFLTLLCVRSATATDLSCTLCQALFNELEGLVAENLSEAAISAAIQRDVCSRLPAPASDVCDVIASDKFLPLFIASLEQKQLPGQICVNLKLCDDVSPPHADPEPVETFGVDLDLPPQQRFATVCGNPAYGPYIQAAIAWLKSWVPVDVLNRVEAMGQDIGGYLPYPFADEITGCANAANIPLGDLILLNVAYEWTDACTSIIAQDENGLNFHVRNLDFGFLQSTILLRNVSVMLNWTRGGSTLFTAASFVGYVGVLSAARPGAFSLSLNTRMMSRPLFQMIDIYVDAMEEKGYSLVSFLSRTALENMTSFSDAIALLSNTELIADVYYIVADASRGGSGCVLARNQTGVVNSTCIDPPAKWFVVETNYDWWQSVPWYDDRMVPATEMLNKIGQSNLSFASLMQLLSTRPVLNQLTAFSALALPFNGTYTVLQRWCNDPCPF